MTNFMRRTGTPCWLDLQTDVERARAFYGAALGWTFTPIGPEFGEWCIARVDGEAVDERQVTQFEEQYQIFLGIALALLFCEWLVSDRRRAHVAWSGRFE